MASSGFPVAFAVALAAVALVIGIVVYRRLRNNRIKRLLACRWGEAPERKISQDELAFIRQQAEALAGEDGFAVDRITWSDLDMDSLYARVNGCFTDAGDHALYGMLRNPTFDAAELGHRSALMAWAKNDVSGREKIKRVLYDLGRTGTIDIATLLGGKPLPGKRWLVYGALSAALAASIALCICGVWPAVVPMLALAVTNSVVSLRSRVVIGKYYSLYQFIPNVLHAARRVSGLGIPELGCACARITERLGRIRGVLGNALLNYYYSFSGQGGSPTDVLMATFNFFFLIDLISLYSLSRNIVRHRAEILGIYGSLGEIDAMIAAASWRETLSGWCEPRLAGEEGSRISFDGMTHPLLDEPVPNSLDIRRNVLLTGSNATGKSTFLKSVALNAILAQSLDTCAARQWEGGFFRVFTSMALKDDLFNRESYFIAEIKSLKRMLDGFHGEPPALCIVDEVLRGTNTGERIAAASEALMQFTAGRGLCLAATHDIELAHILESMYDNMHFTETVTDGGISFDYKLRPGRATSRNAIKLLGLMGYGKEMVDHANARLETFERTGRWG